MNFPRPILVVNLGFEDMSPEQIYRYHYDATNSISKLIPSEEYITLVIPNQGSRSTSCELLSPFSVTPENYETILEKIKVLTNE